MKKIGLTMAMAALAGTMNLAQADEAAPAAPAPAAPAAGVVVFGFEDDAWKAGKFSAENGKLGLAEENATEGKKALVLEFDRTGKAEGDRPTVRINKVVGFAGAKKILIDCTFVGEVSPKTKLRATIRDTAKAGAEASEALTPGKTTLEIDLVTCDVANLSDMKICLDNCKSGQGKLFLDNFRAVK
jgi:hypothetical protein